jgi:catechol 2,3-dioxygenase-like lactoylglutathione lyase family enzyme
MEYKLELVLIPVRDVDAAKKFYLEQAGFDLLVDTPIFEGGRVVQLTPHGSSCSIGFGTGITSAEPGSAQGLHLVVPDITAAREELTGRGVKVSEIRHLEDGAWAPGPNPEHSSYESFADFPDPDGNVWVLQEVDWSKS